MTRKITRPLYLLLDCNVIIKAYELGIWDDLVEKCQLLVPGTVIEEALYYFDADDNKISIDLSAQVKAGAISEIDPTTEDLFKFTRIFASWFIQTLHPGETEALALFCAGKATNAYFCTSDAHAIRALAIMHRSANGKSFEMLLQENGLTKPSSGAIYRAVLRQQFAEGISKFSKRRRLRRPSLRSNLEIFGPVDGGTIKPTFPINYTNDALIL